MSDTFTFLGDQRIRPMQSGQWRGVQGGALSTAAHSASVERAAPFEAPVGTVLQTVAVNVTTLAASSVVRLGARTDVNGRPGTLLADWGTVASDTTGEKTISISFVVPATRIWLTATPQGGAPTLTIRSLAGNTVDGLTSTELFAGTSAVAVFQSGVTGALPGPFTAGGVTAATMIIVQAA